MRLLTRIANCHCVAMGALEDFGHRRLEGFRTSPLPFVATYVDYETRPAPVMPARFNGSARIERAGGDAEHRALLLVDPQRRFEGFLVQFSVGPRDPIDRGGPEDLRLMGFPLHVEAEPRGH